jgi:hypothetical protein
MLDNPDLGAITREFFEFTIQNGCQFVISEVVNKEISDTPTEEKRKAVLLFLKTLNCVLLPYDIESRNLAKVYVSEGILTDNHIDDLRHVAYATVFDCDMIVSWNQKHIAKTIKIQKINDCNMKNNYSMIAIYTPERFLTLYK